MFSDESRSCISTADGRQRVWRRRLTRYAAGNVLERDSWGDHNEMEWGGISLHRRLDIVVFQNLASGRDGNGITAQRYINQVLKPRVVPFSANRPTFGLQQDNARPTLHGYYRLSPTPWDPYLALAALLPAPVTAAEPADCVKDEWRNIPLTFVKYLVLSMNRLSCYT